MRCYLLALVMLLPLTACSQAVRKPQLLHPGPSRFQQSNAELFDPFPLNDIGPEIVGGRPREFQKPPNVVTRSRQGLPLVPVQPVLPVQPAPLVPGVPLY